MKKDDDEVPTYWCQFCKAGPLQGREQLVHHINRRHSRQFWAWLRDSTASHMPFIGSKRDND